MQRHRRRSASEHVASFYPLGRQARIRRSRSGYGHLDSTRAWRRRVTSWPALLPELANCVRDFPLQAPPPPPRLCSPRPRFHLPSLSGITQCWSRAGVTRRDVHSPLGFVCHGAPVHKINTTQPRDESTIINWPCYRRYSERGGPGSPSRAGYILESEQHTSLLTSWHGFGG